MPNLADKHCIPCEEGGKPLTKEQATDLMEQVAGWILSDDATQLTRSFPFKDFADALTFADKVGKLAEEEWHHPDLSITWGRVDVTLSTHSIRGLSESDFILAAKINGILANV